MKIRVTKSGTLPTKGLIWKYLELKPQVHLPGLCLRLFDPFFVPKHYKASTSCSCPNMYLTSKYFEILAISFKTGSRNALFLYGSTALMAG